MLSYTELFNARGSAYDRAMLQYPRARDAGFGQAVRAAGDLKPGMAIGDVPAGGGYLASYLLEGCIYQGHEPCSTFLNNGEDQSSHSAAPQDGTELLPLPWSDGALDVVLSLASRLADRMHCVAARRTFRRWGRRLKDRCSGLAER